MGADQQGRVPRSLFSEDVLQGREGGIKEESGGREIEEKVVLIAVDWVLFKSCQGGSPEIAC